VLEPTGIKRPLFVTDPGGQTSGRRPTLKILDDAKVPLGCFPKSSLTGDSI